ncbi:TPA: Arm DNA-binding domain-containing protein [Yersinia enterocolitica]|nr:Arm DNA-binding domain-containing protein [Yersinia enterocolitica]
MPQSEKRKEKPYKLSDGGGLFLLVNTNGSRYWRLKYRIAGKESCYQ